MPFKWKALQPRLATRLIYVIILAFILIMAGAALGSIFQGGKNHIINEVMTSNRCVIADENGDYPDWFEIYNRGDKAVSLDGYWATDDPAEPYKWAFPTVNIGPGSYLTVLLQEEKEPNRVVQLCTPISSSALPAAIFY
ncbi:MAG: lamin tail domain-containing protein [Bacillota bacterium]|nr:lamin tail domain-containing protein [Bacillota bacterium]